MGVPEMWIQPWWLWSARSNSTILRDGRFGTSAFRDWCNVGLLSWSAEMASISNCIRYRIRDHRDTKRWSNRRKTINDSQSFLLTASLSQPILLILHCRNICMTTCPQLIVVLGVCERQGNYSMRSLLEHPDKWKVRGVTYDPQSIFLHVSS